MIIKTGADWKGSLHEYLEIGDYVDEEIYEHFRDVLPPAYFSSTMVQIGEPYDHVNGKETYPTLLKTNLGWCYVGNCFRGQGANNK